MNTWKTLYIKEIKDNRTLFILLPSVTVFLELVAVLSFDDGQSVPSAHSLWSVVPYWFVLVLPFLLIHSFAQEIKGQTHYLLLSLPVSRAQVFAAKAAAVTTLGLVLFALSTAGLIAVFSELRALPPLADMDIQSIPFTAMHIAVFTGACYLSAMALMLGMAGGIAGLKLVVRRFAGLASAAFVLGMLYCYFGTLHAVFHWIDLPDKALFWSDSNSGVQVSMSPEFLKINFAFFAHSLIVGLASMGIGMWLFEKRAEA